MFSSLSAFKIFLLIIVFKWLHSDAPCCRFLRGVCVCWTGTAPQMRIPPPAGHSHRSKVNNYLKTEILTFSIVMDAEISSNEIATKVEGELVPSCWELGWAFFSTPEKLCLQCHYVSWCVRNQCDPAVSTVFVVVTLHGVGPAVSACLTEASHVHCPWAFT